MRIKARKLLGIGNIEKKIKLNVVVTVGVAKKIEKISKNNLRIVGLRVTNLYMQKGVKPGSRPADREYISFWVDEEYYQRAQVEAQKRGLKSAGVLAKKIVEEAVESVVLTSADYEEILERVKNNEKKKWQS